MQLGVNRATVFNIREHEKMKNTMSAQISTLESKKGEEKKYCSWNARFTGKAYEAAKGLQDKDFIEIKSAKIDNYYSKEKQQLYVNVIIFEFEKVESNQPAPEKPDGSTENKEPEN